MILLFLFSLSFWTNALFHNRVLSIRSDPFQDLFYHRLLFSLFSDLEIVSSLQIFADGSPRPPSNVIWPLGCLPRPLQQVQEDRLRVKRGQSRLHGLVHPEQGRQQKGRQKCELPKQIAKNIRIESFCKTKLGSDLFYLRLASRENFRVERWSAESPLQALPPLSPGGAWSWDCLGFLSTTIIVCKNLRNTLQRPVFAII